MRAASYSSFGDPIRVTEVADPTPSDGDAVIEVRATGVCRSDWHGWQGHDPDIISFPHIPGHEVAGVVAEVGRSVTRWSAGDRVAIPFVSGCGTCALCSAGQSQVCADQTQPGFTHWGSFAERVLIHNADFNLLSLPEAVDFAAAAALGCRFSTAYRAVAEQAMVGPGEWVAVYGCGGVGLSAVMIATALGARAIGIDPGAEARDLAVSSGAEFAWSPDEARERLPRIDDAGPHVTIDAVGAGPVVADAITALRRQGRHVQVGLLPGAGGFSGVTASRVVSHELAIVGSHGISVSGLDRVLQMTAAGDLQPATLIGRRVDLDEGVERLMRMADDPSPGITVITEF